MKPAHVIMALVAFTAIAAITYWQTVQRTGGDGSPVSIGSDPLVVTDVITPKAGKDAKSNGFDKVTVTGPRSGFAQDEGAEVDEDLDEDAEDAEPMDGSEAFSPKDARLFLQEGDRVRKINGIEVRSAREAELVLKALYQPTRPAFSFEVSRRNWKGEKEETTVYLQRGLIDSLRLKGSKGVIDTSIEVGCEDLLWAAQEGNYSAVEQIIKRGNKSCVNFADPLVAEEGPTPLLAAVETENLRVARLLLKFGADVNLANSDGTTPLMRAAELGNREFVVLLMAEGADTQLRNNELRTASDVADTQGFRDISQVIKNPSPRAFLPNDQRIKVPELLAKQNLVNPKNKYHSDAELSKAIKEWQLSRGLAPTGMLTRDQFVKLRRDAKSFETKYDNAREERETVTTLRRMDSRFFLRNWSVVDTRYGFAECEKETVLFELSPDGKEIKMKTYRPGTSLGDLDVNSVKPTREAIYKVERATIEADKDIIVVKNTGSSFSSWKYQTWEIGPATMQVSSMKSLKKKDEAKRGAVLSTCR